MDIIAVLMFGTIGFVVAFGYINARETEKLRQQRLAARRAQPATAPAKAALGTG